MADRSLLRLLLASGCMLAVNACEPCAGTSSCHTPPEVSYTGEVIEHTTGATVSGVAIRFVRQSGPKLLNDTIHAISRDNGFFELRAPAYSDGTVIGALTVNAPAPHVPYTVENVQLKTSRVRGDGGILGRVVVDPYLLLVGQVLDRKTGGALVGARVIMRRVSGAMISPDTVEFITDKDGRFFLQPQVDAFANGDLVLDFEMIVEGHPRAWLVRQRHPVQYLDGGIRFVLLRAGRALLYVAQVSRRGVWQPIPGATIEFARTGGIAVAPETFVQLTNDAGAFVIQPEPLADGDLIFDLTIRPPAPYPVEVLRGLRIASHDDDSTRYMGVFGVGAQAYLRARFVNRATGEPADSGILARVIRLSGVPVETPLAADSGLRAMDSVGVVNYIAPTPDSGSMTFDVEVRLPSPAQWETIRGLAVRARYDSLPNDAGTFRVGLWFPSTVRLVDDLTGAGVAAQVQYQRTGGIAISPTTFVTQSQSDGIVRLQPVPMQSGDVVGNLVISAGALYRDTTIANVRLQTTQDDTLRSGGVFRLKRAP